MRTNIKNGIIFLGQVATDTATIRIGEIEPSNLDLKFTTKADGFYPVFAETNDIGMVERLFIDVNPNNWDLFMNDKITIIDPENVVSGRIEDAQKAPKDV
jgi:hypothetical protein